jgi:hypothetical protein
MLRKPHEPWLERSFETIAPMPVGYVVGVDIGKKRDWTAINVIERSVGWTVCQERSTFGRDWAERDRKRILQHGVVHVERPALHTPYPAVARRVLALLDALPAMKDPPALVVDATGVGQPIVDMFRGVGLRPVAVTITGGKQVIEHSGREISVPKLALMENVKALIQDDRLKIAKGLTLSAEIERELSTFGQKISETGHESFEGVGEHDDIVLSIALSAWWSEHKPAAVTQRQNFSFMGR